MKTITFISIIAMLIGLNSCVQNTTNQDLAPQIQYAATPSINGVPMTSNVDTLIVGDTLLLPLALQGYYNPLISFRVSNDTTVSKVTFPGISALGSAILDNDSTNLAKGYLFFGTNNFATVQLLVQYVPTKPSNTAVLRFTLASTSNYSPTVAQMAVPAKAKP
ncbi:MAG: hypothetical protein ACP5F6_05000 [Microbacter sp.]